MGTVLPSLLQRREGSCRSYACFQHIGVNEPIRKNPDPVHPSVQVNDLVSMTRQGERPKQRVLNINSSLASFIKHPPGILDGVHLGVHVDELGRQGRVLVEAILQKMAVRQVWSGSRERTRIARFSSPFFAPILITWFLSAVAVEVETVGFDVKRAKSPVWSCEWLAVPLRCLLKGGGGGCRAVWED